MRKLCIALLVSAASTSPSAAQWLYEGGESAFDGDAPHVVLTGKGQYGFGLRCRGGDVEAIYITPDRSMTDDMLSVANTVGPQLRLRVDKDPVISLDVELANNDGSLVGTAAIDVKQVWAIRDAKRSVAVVLTLGGENYHENSFGVRGSTKAIDQMIAGCGLEASDAGE